MKITFLGAARTVTGSCYLLEHNGCSFLVDCGMFQGNKAVKEHNYGDFAFNPAVIDFVLLTHAHIDHSGLLPKLWRYGFTNPIYTTTGTALLSEIMLPDSGYIQEMEVERKNRKLTRAGKKLLTPIYTAADATAMQHLFHPVAYNESFYPADGIEVILRDAGHILGSAMVEIYYQEQGQRHKIIFTGDLGRNNQAIVEDPFTEESCDFLTIESTYGDRLHTGGFEEEKPRFAQIIKETISRGGNVVIPAFAVDRTQDILMLFYEMQQTKMIPVVPIYVDSPMAVKATEIFAAHPEYFDAETVALFCKEGKAPFLLDNMTYARTAAESMRLNEINGAVIISASGMADAGRIKHHLKHNLWRPESSVVFFGFQADGSLGRRLLDGESKVTIHGEEIEVRASIYNMDGFSAHADYEEILAWLGQFKQLPKQIFVTHGNESSALSLAQKITEQYHVTALVPRLGDIVELAQEAAQVSGNSGREEIFTTDKLYADIDTALQKIIAGNDLEKLIRIREFLDNLAN